MEARQLGLHRPSFLGVAAALLHTGDLEVRDLAPPEHEPELKVAGARRAAAVSPGAAAVRRVRRGERAHASVQAVGVTRQDLVLGLIKGREG